MLLLELVSKALRCTLLVPGSITAVVFPWCDLILGERGSLLLIAIDFGRICSSRKSALSLTRGDLQRSCSSFYKFHNKDCPHWIVISDDSVWDVFWAVPVILTVSNNHSREILWGIPLSIRRCLSRYQTDPYREFCRSERQFLLFFLLNKVLVNRNVHSS